MQVNILLAIDMSV